MVLTLNGRRLERAMQKKGWTAADLAYEMRRATGGRIKTTESQVYKWIAGKHSPVGDTVVVLARLLEETVETLYGHEGDDEDDEDQQLLRELRRLPADQMPRDLLDRVTARLAARSTTGAEVTAP